MHIGALDISYKNCSSGQAQLDNVLTACFADGVDVCDYVVTMSPLGLACANLCLTALRDMAKSMVVSMQSGALKVLSSALAQRQVATARSA